MLASISGRALAEWQAFHIVEDEDDRLAHARAQSEAGVRNAPAPRRVVAR